MSTSFIGDVSIVEVCGNVCGLYFMLEEFLKKSRRKCHNVAARCNKLTTRHMPHSIHGDYWDVPSRKRYNMALKKGGNKVNISNRRILSIDSLSRDSL